MKKIIILIVLLVITAGCNEVSELTGYNEVSELSRKRQELQQKLDVIAHTYVDKYSTDEVKNAISEGKLLIGMVTFEVAAVKGHPKDINKTTGAWGVHEQWVYDNGRYNEMYLYFENNILTSWQD